MVVLGQGEMCLEDLEAAVRAFLGREGRGVDLKRYRAIIDSLEGDFAAVTQEAKKNGDHLVDGNITAASWISRTCGMSVTSAADRLCVGTQLQSLPKIAAALAAGEIGYQSTSILCHLREQLGEKRDLFIEEEMLDLAQRHSVFNLRLLCRIARHVADPDGFFNEAEHDYTRRRLHVSLMSDGMYAIDGVLDPEGGAALKAALHSLARPRGPEDDRTGSQRTADALTELVLHAMDEGKLPRRNGVRPHVTVTTTLEGLKNEVGAPAADVELSLPISTRTLERLACDCTLSRVLLADSMVIDVGRATRIVSAPTRRALWGRDKGCRGPGCERPIDWTSPHHIIAWIKGGASRLSNLVSVCYFHHRLVHEGGWQVV